MGGLERGCAEMVNAKNKQKAEQLACAGMATLIVWIAIIAIPRHDPWDCHRTADQARGGARGVNGAAVLWQSHASVWDVPHHQCRFHRSLRHTTRPGLGRCSARGCISS